MSGIKLSHIHSPCKDDIPETVYGFLCQLGGASVIHIEGHDTSRCRVLITLLHGNEPSGLKALHTLLREGFTPQVNCKVIVASVLAARTEPAFHYRMLPNQKDLNRCFGNDRGSLQCKLADAIAKQVAAFEPEAVIDLHNTSGSGPAFAVSVHNTQSHLALASHFTHRLIYTDIRLGSVMEQDFGCPVLTIEAGGAQDDEADKTALLGMRSFFSAPKVFELKQDIEHLHLPRRLELNKNLSICYATEHNNTCDITIRQDIEHLNFGNTLAGQTLGWSNAKLETIFTLDAKKNTLGEYFVIENKTLKTRQALTLFMVTTRVDIAQSDCLFYFVPAG